MSDAQLVRAVGPNGTERYVPAHWLDKDRSPFPGRWTEVKEKEAAKAKGANVAAVAGDGHEDPVSTTTTKGA